MATYIGKIKVDGTNELPVASTLYGTCDTAAATTAKVVTCANFDKLITGVTIHVRFTNSNSVANPTLNVNSTGAIGIMRYGTTRPGTLSKTSWNAGAVISFTYDGSYWMMNDWLNDDDHQVTMYASTADSERAVILDYVANSTGNHTNYISFATSLKYNAGKKELKIDGMGIGYPVVTTLPATVVWNTEYRLASATSAITFTLPAITSMAEEVRVLFEAGDNPSLTITPPSGVTLYGISDIAIASGKRYELSAAVIGPTQIGVLCKEWG